jgi:hypothetical protein
VESGVEHSDLGSLGHNSLASLDTHQVSGVMQRSQGDALLDSSDDIIVNDAGIGELHTAVQNTVANSIDLINGLDHAVNGINQDVQDCGNSLGVAGHGDILNDLIVADLVGQTAVDIDTLTQALGGYITGLGVHQLILQAGAAGVDNQNIHEKLPPVK